MTLTFKKLLPLVKDYPFKPYLYLKSFGISRQSINLFFEEEIKLRFLKDPLIESFVFAGQLNAAVLFRKLGFDTEILQQKVGKIDYLLSEGQEASLLEIIKNLIISFQKIDLEYVTYRLSSKDTATIAGLEAHRFERVDEYNILLAPAHFDLDFKEDSSVSIREATEADITTLQKNIAPSFIYSRFFTDIKISKKNAIKMHEEWIANSIKKQVADHVLVATIENKPVGFISLEMDKDAYKYLNKRIGHIPLIGTDPEFRGRHIGLSLTKAAFKRWFSEQQAELIRIETQASNIPANKTYLKAGFTNVDKEITLRWSNQE